MFKTLTQEQYKKHFEAINSAFNAYDEVVNQDARAAERALVDELGRGYVEWDGLAEFGLIHVFTMEGETTYVLTIYADGETDLTSW
jgi:hypothetical protein